MQQKIRPPPPKIVRTEFAPKIFCLAPKFAPKSRLILRWENGKKHEKKAENKRFLPIFSQFWCGRSASPLKSLHIFLFIPNKKRSMKLRFLFGADEGTCAFAARPGAQHTVLCGLLSCFQYQTSDAQTVCSRKRLPPQVPSYFLVHTKQKTEHKAPFFVWCGRRDLKLMCTRKMCKNRLFSGKIHSFSPKNGALPRFAPTFN